MTEKTSRKTAIVTGGTSGIGKAITQILREAGIQVVVADLAKGENDQDGVFYRRCDVTNGEDIDALYSWTKENVGLPDILVLNAGQGIQEKLTVGDPEKWQKIINTNLMGPLRAVRSFVPDMVEKGKGNVIFISSVSANQPHPYGGIYSASKTALEVVAETLRLETLPNVSVTVISPGIVDTSFFKNQASGDSSVEEMGMGAISPEEIAEDVWYAINKRSGTSINKIITRSTLQNF